MKREIDVYLGLLELVLFLVLFVWFVCLYACCLLVCVPLRVLFAGVDFIT
jgi:hypothetical protein